MPVFTRYTDKIKRAADKACAFISDFRHTHISYAQGAEDLYIRGRFGADKTNGFFIDIGAHHPKRMSNTWLFYRMGWSGLNIDAMPGSMELFRRLRPRDINIECGVGEEASTQLFYVYSEPAFNTFDKALVEERKIYDPQQRVVRQVEVPIKPLRDILKEHLKPGQPIDFMSLDVEGYDFIVLKSNDWNAYRPRFIVIESFEDLLAFMESDMYRYMVSVDYKLVARLGHAAVFEDNRHA